MVFFGWNCHSTLHVISFLFHPSCVVMLRKLRSVLSTRRKKKQKCCAAFIFWFNYTETRIRVRVVLLLLVKQFNGWKLVGRKLPWWGRWFNNQRTYSIVLHILLRFFNGEFFCFFFLSFFIRMTKALTALKPRPKEPASRYTNVVRSIWPSSDSFKCPVHSPTLQRWPWPPVGVTIINTCGLVERRQWQQQRSAANLVLPPRSSGGCHRGATNEESSTEPVTVRFLLLFSSHFSCPFSSSSFSRQTCADSTVFIHYSFIRNHAGSLLPLQRVCVCVFGLIAIWWYLLCGSVAQHALFYLALAFILVSCQCFFLL